MHNYGFNPNIEEKYLKLLNASKELKRLQKEIDEQQSIEEKSVIDNWGKDNDDVNPPDYQNGFEAYKKKTELQSKIKQLIEEL